MSLARTTFSSQPFLALSKAVYPGHVQICNRKVLLNIFKRKIKEDEPKPVAEIEPERAPVKFSNYTENNLKKRTSIQTRRAYLPPEDVEGKALRIVKEVYGKTADVQNIDLDEDRRKKFTVLTKMMKEFDHFIPNTELHDMKSIDQAVNFFRKEVRDTTCLEDLTKLDLPKNLHINTEYLRYDRENNPMWPGKDAFPGKQSRAFSAKFARKYNVVDKSKDKYIFNLNRKTFFEEQTELAEIIKQEVYRK